MITAAGLSATRAAIPSASPAIQPPPQMIRSPSPVLRPLRPASPAGTATATRPAPPPGSPQNDRSPGTVKKSTQTHTCIYNFSARFARTRGDSRIKRSSYALNPRYIRTLKKNRSVQSTACDPRLSAAPLKRISATPPRRRRDVTTPRRSSRDAHRAPRRDAAQHEPSRMRPL